MAAQCRIQGPLAEAWSASICPDVVSIGLGRAFKDKVILVDLKTKSASWKGPSKEDLLSYKAQAGGYLYLLSDGDDARGGCMVSECRTLIVTPNTTKWLPAYDPDDCYEAWENCWDLYSASAALNPF